VNYFDVLYNLLLIIIKVLLGLQGAIVLTASHFILSSYLLYKKSSRGDDEWKWCLVSLGALLILLILLIIDYTKQKKNSLKVLN